MTAPAGDRLHRGVLVVPQLLGRVSDAGGGASGTLARLTCTSARRGCCWPPATLDDPTRTIREEGWSMPASSEHSRPVRDEVTVGSRRRVGSGDVGRRRSAAVVVVVLETATPGVPGPTSGRRPGSGRRAVAPPRVLVATVVSVAGDPGVVGWDVSGRSLQSRVHRCDGRSP
jgi:hypothetical protein